MRISDRRHWRVPDDRRERGRRDLLEGSAHLPLINATRAGGPEDTIPTGRFAAENRQAAI